MADTNFAFPLTLRKPETQTLEGWVIGSFALGRIFDTNFAFPSTLQPFFPFLGRCNGRHQFCVSVDTQKTGDPNFRGVGNWKFHSRMRFWGATAIFPIFVMADTNFAFPSTLRKPETQTLGGG